MKQEELYDKSVGAKGTCSFFFCFMFFFFMPYLRHIVCHSSQQISGTLTLMAEMCTPMEPGPCDGTWQSLGRVF